MNPVHLLRSVAGLTQQEMAARAGTSQPTIAAYEAGTKSPTMSTLQRMAAVLGLDLVISCVPALTREDRRSLFLHRAVAQKLRQNPTACVRRARQTLHRMSHAHPYAHILLNRWADWLKLPTETLILHMLDPQPEAREMRHVSPFAGVLAPQERVRLLQAFRRNESPSHRRRISYS